MKTSLPLAEFPGANPLVQDYASDFDRVGGWFHYDPRRDEAIEARLAELDARPAADRSAARDAVARRMELWGADPDALAAASALGEPGCYAILTGQQAGLFGGPLYAVHKAVSAVILARSLAGRFPGRRFVPTFWISSGDSDFDEVRSASLLAQDGSLSDLELPPAPVGTEARIIAAHDVSSQLPVLLDALAGVLPGGEFRDEVLEALHAAYSSGSLVDGFARWMCRLFAGTGLVLIEPQLPELMACAAPLMERELGGAADCEDALVQRNREIAGAGYALQVEQPDGDTNLFLLDDEGNREKIARGSNGFVLRPSGRELSVAGLAEMTSSSPESFVCGVMLRPVYQNVLFPAAAFIGGAAELAYRAQATAVFEFHGEQLAPAFLRATATLLSAKQARLLDELGWELPDCYTVPQDLAARAVEDLRPEELDAAMENYRRQLHEADRDLQTYAERLDPNLGKSFETLRENLTRHADKLEKKISGALKQKHSTLISQVDRLHTAVYPGQVVQERRINALSFLPRHGFGLVRQLLDTLEFPAWEHQAVILD